MPAKLVRSFSKKFNAVRNLGSSSSKQDKKNKLQTATTTEETSKSATSLVDGYGYVQVINENDIHQPNKSSNDDDEAVPGFVPSDNSSDESSEDENDAAEKYGYGDAAPDGPKLSSVDEKKQLGLSTPQYRRASLSRRNQRRASISTVAPTAENVNDTVNVPFHPHRTPRRSSLKGTQPVGRRRASVSGPSSFEAIDLNMLQEIDPASVMEVKLPGRRDSIKRRRSITFNEDVHVRKIAPAKDLTSKPKELWFQDNEYSTIKKKTRALLESVDKKTGLVNGKKYCIRGLERYMEPSHVRDAKKYSAWDSVLLEQEVQREEGTFCDESIGNMYKATTRRSVIDAQRQANKDADEVAAFYETTAAAAIVAAAVTDDDESKPQRRGRRASIA
jgi:hypothetical protein